MKPELGVKYVIESEKIFRSQEGVPYKWNFSPFTVEKIMKSGIAIKYESGQHGMIDPATFEQFAERADA